MARIYISSTFKDLQAHREVVYRTLRQLRHDVIAMEDYVASDSRPLDKCLADVAGCDLYIGILAFAYGHVPAEANPRGRSITELEYRKAVDSGVPALVFLLKDGAAWPTDRLDAIGGSDHGSRIAALRAELMASHVTGFFEDAQELARLASVAVQQALAGGPAPAIRFDWSAPRERFIAHMRNFNGARSEKAALRRYAGLRLQGTRPDAKGQLPVGSWQELVAHPVRALLVGEAGTGKTTLLLREVAEMSASARDIAEAPLPIHFPLRYFKGGDGDTLLEAAAAFNGMEPGSVRSLWQAPSRPVCLVLDGLDETPYAEDVLDAIAELVQALDLPQPSVDGTARQDPRSLIVACVPGSLHERVSGLRTGWSEFLTMPLGDSDIDAMLARFDASALQPILDEGLRETIRRPDLLAALAQSARDLPAENLPRSAAQIHDIHIRHTFARLGGDYDDDRIKRPLLAELAYRLAQSRQHAIAYDDALLDWTARVLGHLHDRYVRRRLVMPPDWTADACYRELLRSPFLAIGTDPIPMLGFTKPLYRDYFLAEHLARLGIGSQPALDLAASLGPRAEQLQPLGFLLGLAGEAAAVLFEQLPRAALPAATQIWLEGRPARAPAPTCLSEAFERRAETLRSELATLEETPLDDELPWSLVADKQVRERFKFASGLASTTPLPVRALLDAAMDTNPLVRAVADHALIHAGDPNARLSMALDEGRFAWVSCGAGTARIGPLRLLDVPVPMAIDLAISIRRIDFDPFEADAEFRFLPMTPALFAAGLFAGDAGVDWIELLARCRQVSAVSASLARGASSRPSLASLAQRLAARARSFAEIGTLLADDLGLDWRGGGQLPEPTPAHPASEPAYRDLRRLFSRANQARTLRSDRVAEDNVIQATASIERLEGESIGLHIDRIEGQFELGSPRLLFIHDARSVERVDPGARLRSFEIDRACGFSASLPTSMHFNSSMSISRMALADVGVLVVKRLESAACPWRIRISLSIERFVDSRLSGVVIETFAPQP